MEIAPKNVLFIGRPGSGKGTQAKLLAEHLSWPAFSSGGNLKKLIDVGGPLAEHIRKDYDQGKFSPDWLAAYFFEQAVLEHSPEVGVVAEGFPRSLPQAELADQIFTWLGQPYTVVHLKVSEEEALRRQLSRAQTEHRPDSDVAEKIQARFEVYRTLTEPALDFFKEKGTLVEVDGEKTPEEIAQDIRTALAV
jgi:adenylate kinase